MFYQVLLLNTKILLLLLLLLTLHRYKPSQGVQRVCLSWPVRFAYIWRFATANMWKIVTDQNVYASWEIINQATKKPS